MSLSFLPFSVAVVFQPNAKQPLAGVQPTPAQKQSVNLFIRDGRASRTQRPDDGVMQFAASTPALRVSPPHWGSRRSLAIRPFWAFGGRVTNENPKSPRGV